MNGESAPSIDTINRETELSVHILGVSAALVGVCLTVIGLLQVVQRLRNLNTPTDDLLAGDAVLFLVACLFAYSSLRSPSFGRQRRRLERAADGCFLCALAIMTFVAGAIAFQLLERASGGSTAAAASARECSENHVDQRRSFVSAHHMTSGPNERAGPDRLRRVIEQIAPDPSSRRCRARACRAAWPLRGSPAGPCSRRG